MDPRTNPYAPGAENPPPELVGRDDIIELVFQYDEIGDELA